ncbi:hypothetical protein Tco_0216559 [Tanacetum coccineum]
MVNFIKTLGYVDTLTKVSQVVVNKLHQPWRIILSILNKSLTRKASGIDRNARLEKLMYVAKGEPRGKPTFGMPILESRSIKDAVQFQDVLKQSPLLISVTRSYEAFSMTRLVMWKKTNANKLSKEIKKQSILEEIKRKASGEGLGAALESLDHIDSSDSSNDDKTESDRDSDHEDSDSDSEQGDKSNKSDNNEESVESENDESTNDSDDADDQTAKFMIKPHDKELGKTQT